MNYVFEKGKTNCAQHSAKKCKQMLELWIWLWTWDFVKLQLRNYRLRSMYSNADAILYLEIVLFIDDQVCQLFLPFHAFSTFNCFVLFAKKKCLNCKWSLMWFIFCSNLSWNLFYSIVSLSMNNGQIKLLESEKKDYASLQRKSGHNVLQLAYSITINEM